MNYMKRIHKGLTMYVCSFVCMIQLENCSVTLLDLVIMFPFVTMFIMVSLIILATIDCLCAISTLVTFSTVVTFVNSAVVCLGYHS
jgi:hypothetical protein